VNILIYHPINGTNLGDMVILEGTKRLLFAAFGNDHDISYLDLDMVERNLGYLKSKVWKDVDMFIIAGTPWLWDACDRSRKYSNLQAILDLLPEDSVKVALGLGSCFPLASNASDLYVFDSDNPPRERLRIYLGNIYSKFDFVSTRDRLAYHILDRLGIDVMDTICPAAYAGCDFIPDNNSETLEPKRPLLVFLNPRDGVSKESCDEVFMDDYIDFQIQFKKQYNPVVATMDPLDRDWCVGQGWEVKWLLSVDELMQEIKRCSFVLTGRVHAAVPAAVCAKPAYIMPVDTRFLTATRVGVIPVMTFGSDVSYFNFKTKLEDIVYSSLSNSLATEKVAIVEKLQEIRGNK
jgi:hypothetical protein